LPYYYLEYVTNALDVPLFFVRGNHDHVVEYSTEGHQRTRPHGGVDLHRRNFNHKGMLLAGIQGSLRYREGYFMHSQAEMWQFVFQLVPVFLHNRMVNGRFVDVFISHAPPAGIHDQPDLPHHGIKAFRWLIDVFQPAYFFHGHIHVYNPNSVTETRLGDTLVINTYGFNEIELELDPR
jgi:Icc-related predicted phosphoesterase